MMMDKVELDSRELDRVEDLLVEWEQLRRRESSVSLEELCHDVPHLRAEVQKRIEALQATDWLFDTIDDRPAAESPAKAPTQIGEYEILSCLGSGGMGAVYLARHRKLDKRVAIKVLATGRAMNLHSTARFEREMRAIGKLEHAHVVAAYDAGEIDGTHYLAMQFVDGIDVSQVLKQRGRLPIADACEIARQAALGLQYVHEHGLIHRDVKPSNLMISREGVVKVLDVGLARLVEKEETPSQLTSVGNILGTVDFMPPEQCDDCHAVDARGDVFALGATLFKLLTGAAPLEQQHTSTTLKKLRALAQGEIPKLTSRGEFPASLAALVNRMLSAKVADRPSSAAEVAQRLAPFCNGSNLRTLLEPAHSVSTQQAVASTQVVERPTRFRGLTIAAIALLAASVLAAAATIYRIETDRGVITVKAGQGVTVEVLQKSGALLKHTKTGQSYRIVIGDMPLMSGDYQLDVTEETSGLRFSTRRLSIGRGSEEELEVTLAPLVDPPPPSPLAADSVTAKLLFNREYEFAKCYRAIFTPDGKSLLVTGDAESVVVLDTATGEEQRRLKGHRRHSRSVAMMSDGKTVISSNEGGDILFHRLDSGELVREIRHAEAPNTVTRTLQLSPDEKSIVASGNFGVEVIDLATGNSKNLRRGTSYTSSFDRDGKLVWAQISSNGIQRINVETKQAEALLPERAGGLFFHLASHVAVFAVETEPCRIEVLDLRTGKVQRTFPISTGKLPVGQISHSGQWLALTSHNQPIRIYDFSSGREILQIPFVNSRLTTLNFSTDDRQLVACNENKRLAVWSLIPAPAPSQP
jgi:serine/threonine protein kinase